MKPRARPDLTTARVRDEVVVYDFRNHQARCLNVTAATVFSLCDGTRTVRQIAAGVGRKMGIACDESVVWMALAKLDEGGMFEPALAIGRTDLRRRALLKKMALTAGLSVALPAVWSILAPTPAYAASSVVCIPQTLCTSTTTTCCDVGNGTAGVCMGTGMCMGSNGTCHGQTCIGG